MITLMKIQTDYYSTQMKQNPKFFPHLVKSDLGLGQLDFINCVIALPVITFISYHCTNTKLYFQMNIDY
jgi:hypothetical protein